MLPSELNAALAPGIHWKLAYPVVAQLARDALAASGTLEFSTVELAEAIYPEAMARGPEGLAARKRVFDALAALAKHASADCCYRAEPRKNGYGNMVRPWRWHAPKPRKLIPCPHCAGKGYLDNSVKA